MATDEPQDVDWSGDDGHESAVAIGTLIIETYEIQQLINVGGMGEVYRGINVHTQDPVAIKIVLPSLAHDPKISALFQKEAQVLGRLFHDSIVRYHIYTFDKGIGRPCLVMEFVEGESLTDHLEKGPMPEAEVRRLVRRLAEGLGQAHNAGTVHRDLTPNNVILPGESVDQAKIIDFGIAKTTTAGSGTVLQGQFAGTLNFVSPEQLGDFGGKIDGRSDIYSLALLAAACCRGETIDMGTSVVEAVNARRGVPDISDVYSGLRPILAMMLAPNPENRPESMEKVIRLLDAPPESLEAEVPEPAVPIAADRTVIAPLPSVPPVSGVTGTAPPTSLPPSGGTPGLGEPVALGEPSASSQSAGPPPAAPRVPHPGLSDTSGRDETMKSARKRRSGLPVLLVLLAAIGGGGYYAYTSGMIPGFAPVPPNVPPVAADDTAETAAATLVRIAVLQNDRDANGDTLQLVSVEQPAGGTAEIDGQTVVYVPREGFDGTDTFGYVVTDGNGGEATADVQVAVAKPPVDSPEVKQAKNAAFLAEYDLGGCAFLDVRKAGPDRMEAEGYALDPSVFERLRAEFGRQRGAELAVSSRTINSAQCAALDFVRFVRANDDERPGLILDRDVLVSGAEIRGTIKDFRDKETWLFLVDGDGGVYDVSTLVELLGDNVGTFGMQIQLTAGSPPAPQLLLMVLTDKPITTAKAVRNGSPARTLLPLVEQELRAADLDPSAAIGFFRLEN